MLNVSIRFVVDNCLNRGISRMKRTRMPMLGMMKLSDSFRKSPLAKIKLDLTRDNDTGRTGGRAPLEFKAS
jgi:hypothetical protein